MNYQSYRVMSEGIQAMGQALLRNKMMKQQEEQRAFENKLREGMAALQQRQAEASMASAERDFGFRKDRAGVEDQRYADETGYRRGRDQMGDQRYTDETGYRRGRDQMGDQRYNDELLRRAKRDFAEDNFKAMEMNLRKQDLMNRRNPASYLDEELDDEGNVIRTRRRTPIRGDGSEAGPGLPRPQAQEAFRSPAELIAAVSSGKISKADAKAYAAERGWK